MGQTDNSFFVVARNGSNDQMPSATSGGQPRAFQ